MCLGRLGFTGGQRKRIPVAQFRDVQSPHVDAGPRTRHETRSTAREALILDTSGKRLKGILRDAKQQKPNFDGKSAFWAAA
jgi:hypothetical protein